MSFKRTKATFCTFCLEDTKSRVQQRLWKLTDEASPRLHIATSASKIGGDLISQLREFVAGNPETCLIIIDTLQMVRSVSKDSAYAADYGDMNALKKFADKNGLAILCIHHNRKMGDSDVFNTVSGTNGITGAADCTMVLNNLNRSAHRAMLSVTGRDVDKIRMNDCEWELIEKISKEELEEREVLDDVLRVLAFMMTRPVEWKGTTTELYTQLSLDNIEVARYGTPEDIAAMCMYLASNESSYFTGQVVTVDGGLNAHVSTMAQFRAMVSRTW